MQCITEKAKLKELRMANNMEIQIAKAALEDIHQINNIETTLEHRILSYDLLSSTLNKDMYYYFVAKINEKIIGYIAAEFLVDHFDLLAIAVSNDYRRQNIATMLLNKLLNTCKELDITDIFLEVRCNNLSAIKFYERNGFEKISVRKNYYKDTSEDAYIYKIVV